ncbi:MAG TPA: ABC transporter permease [Geminicoccaceae bacterium]|nr:ABC transporter permease [Geminicoccaceae bacterium]
MRTTTAVDGAPAATAAEGGGPYRPGIRRRLAGNGGVLLGGVLLLAVALMALLAPWLWTGDPVLINPVARNDPPAAANWMGTDALGRDLYSRVVYGARVSLVLGLAVALFSVLVGLVIGLVSGYVRRLDAIVMRVMDGLMSIPAILLAITLVAISGSSLFTVVVAITVPEIPRVVRLVRGVVLSIREEPYVEAAIAVGTPPPAVIARHILPNTIAPLIVQGTYVCASAIITESILSFLGAGIPPEIPTWGNTMAEGRIFFQIAPWVIFFPGVFLAVTVLAINLLGDGLRDTLDPRLAERMGAAGTEA